MQTRSLLVLAGVILPLLPLRGGAQCSDPTPPRSGFQRRFETNHPITFSDGYKSLANVLYPTATPGPCGWPLLVLVHGLSGNRNTPSVEAVALAAAGYFVVAYDVRAQGDARALNPGKGSTLWGLDEWIDMAEIIDWVAKKFPRLVDKTRIGVFGDSQGGMHAWAAAAYSGRRLPPNPRRSAPFPVIRCAVPRFFGPHMVRIFVPDETAFLQHVPGLAFAQNHVIAQIDTAYRAKLAQFLDADDPKGLAAWMRSLPGKDFIPELEKTTVPILAVLGWRDSWSDPNEVLALFKRMPASTPKRLYLTTGPHGEPTNVSQGFRHLFLTESWFRRWLKGDRDPIEKGPPFLTASTPPDSSTYVDPRSLWPHRMESRWPPRGTLPKRLYLRSANRLTEQRPAATEGFDVVTNRVTAGYSARQYFRDAGAVATVQKSIPLSNIDYTTAPLADVLEIAGTPVVSLSVLPNARKFLVAARLVSVAPNGAVLVLTSGGTGVLQASQHVDIELGAVATVLPKGYRLRLQVRNLDIQKPLASEAFRRVPFFGPSSIRIDHAGLALSWLDLSVRPRVAPDITTQATTISVTAPLPKTLAVRSSYEWRGAFYVVLLGLSGQGPAIVLPNGSEMWLVPDAATLTFVQAVNLPVQRNFAGLLDANGGATCTLDLSGIGTLPLSLVGVFAQVMPMFFTFSRGFEAGSAVRLRFR